VPRGAFVLISSGHILLNEHFCGLSLAEAGKLDNYFHFRPPEHQRDIFSTMHKTALDKADDFLDVACDDIPKGEQRTE